MFASFATVPSYPSRVSDGGGGSVALSISTAFSEYVESTSQSYTRTIDLGTAGGTRQIFVAYSAAANTTIGVPTCTLDGASMSPVITYSSTGTGAGIFSISKPTGTSGSWVIDFGGGNTCQRIVYGVYAVYGTGAVVVESKEDHRISNSATFTVATAAPFVDVSACIAAFSADVVSGAFIIDINQTIAAGVEGMAAGHNSSGSAGEQGWLYTGGSSNNAAVFAAIK